MVSLSILCLWEGGMEQPVRKIVIFLLALVAGYCAGFRDAQINEQTIFRRAVQRVQNFGERTVGEPAREREEAADRIGG
jgi:hypothetical protein